LTTTVLAIDTAMAACSAAVWRDGILAHRFEPMARGQAERIAPMVEEVMREAGLGFDELDRIAVTIGPGTFTGQRIGLSMARGLGLALGVPVSGLTTTETIASALLGKGRAVVVACDARRDECYFAIFTERLESLHDVAVLPLDVIARRLPAGTAYVVGSAAGALIAASGRGDLVRARDFDLPDAANLAALAAARPVPGRPPEPLYLRPPNAKPASGRSAKPSLVIRRAGSREAAAIAAVHALCFDRPWDARAIVELMAAPGTSAWLAEVGGEACGLALARQAADEVEILSLCTVPGARRRGIAREFVNALVAAHAYAGAIYIEVAADNVAARSLYGASGFVEAGRRAGYYASRDGQRRDAIVMRKTLKP
jgi:tRNA threonylcarbamoyladenosine biosynthesis protein TsaB